MSSSNAHQSAHGSGNGLQSIKKQEGASGEDSLKQEKDERKHKPLNRVPRACNACRKQKMRCEGADQPPCRRCRHAGLECLFEKPSREPTLTGEAGLERIKAIEASVSDLRQTQIAIHQTLAELVQQLRSGSVQPMSSNSFSSIRSSPGTYTQGSPSVSTPTSASAMMIDNSHVHPQTPVDNSYQGQNVLPPMIGPSQSRQASRPAPNIPYRSPSAGSGQRITSDMHPPQLHSSHSTFQGHPNSNAIYPQVAQGPTLPPISSFSDINGRQSAPSNVSSVRYNSGDGSLTSPRQHISRTPTALHNHSGHRSPKRKAAGSSNVTSSNTSDYEEEEDNGELPSKGLVAPWEVLRGLADVAAERAAQESGENSESGSRQRSSSPDPKQSNPAKRRKTTHKTVPRATFQDVVTKRLISEQEARDLFKIYYAGCSTFLPVFDSNYDTYESLHERSPFAFDAVCMVAAKVRDGGGPPSETYLKCLEAVQTISCATLFAPVTRQEAVQAMILVSGWSDNGWLSGGHAVRMAAELSMHQAWPKLLRRIESGKAANSNEDRRLIVASRVWFCLYLFEHQMSYGTGRPAILRDDESIWGSRLLLKHPLAIQDDMRLCSTLELMAIRERIHNKLSPDHPINEQTFRVLQEANQEFHNWFSTWDSAFSQKYEDAAFYRQSLQIQQLLAELFHNAYALRGIDGPEDVSNSPPHLQDLAQKTLHIAQQALTITVNSPSYREGLKYAVHYTHATATFTASFILRLVRLFPDQVDLEHIYNLVQQLIDVLSEIPARRYANTLTLMLKKCRKRKNSRSPTMSRPSGTPTHPVPNERQFAISQTPISPTFDRNYSQHGPVHPGHMPMHVQPQLNADAANLDQIWRGFEGTSNEQLPVWLSDNLGGNSLQQLGLEAFMMPAEYDQRTTQYPTPQICGLHHEIKGPMSTLGSPSDLFTAGEQAPSTSADPIGSTPGSSGIVHATHTISLKDASFYVEVPKLSPESLRKYESANIHDSEALSWGETPAKPLYVRGELHLDGQVWLFVKYDDGLFRKFSPSEIKKKLPQLAAKYATRKIRKRHLITTDPYYYVIHPDFNNGPNSLYFTYNTDDDDETSEYVHVKRRSREGSSSSRSESQFEETDEESDYQPRRSSRAAKKISYATHDDSDFGEEEMSSAGSNDYNSSSGRSERIKSKKIRRGPKPAYGRICSRFDKYYSYDMTPALQRHYDVCEKCHRAPSHILLERAKRSKKKRRRDDDELDPNDEEYLTRLGGWVRCLKCCTASHWRCLSAVQRSEIVKAVRARAETKDSLTNAAAIRFKDLETDEATDFVCGPCSKGGICMICHEIAIKPETKEEEIAPSDDTITKMEVDGELDKGLELQESGSGEGSTELLFRCFRCKRLAHYHHLTKPDEDSATVAEVADHYQEVNKWECRDCASYTLPVDKIIAWRPYPADAKDEYMDQLSLPKYRENLPREYLIKWKTRSYRRPTWVPHMWLLSTHMARLKNFYEMGPRIQLSDNQDDNKERTINDEHALMTEGSSREASLEASQMVPEGPPTSMPDAETRIPKMWKTVERILDVRIWTPLKDDQSNIGFSNGNLPADIQKEFDNAFELGIEPSGDFDEGINEFEKRTGRKLQDNDADKIVWAFIKWDDLPYDEATWDSPPRPGELGYHEYCRAFKSFLFARTVTVERRSSSFYKTLDESGGRFASKLKIPSDGMYDIGQDAKSKLMPFQIEGVNWLSYNFAKKYSSILADEMGLGKTVQIITFLGLLHSKLDLYPFLIVVPNSTISNWVREFSRWAPNLRVVPFYGEAESRKIIMKYELHHEKAAPGTTGAKYHVLVTTYETVTGKNDFHTVFKKNPRWELLIVDEGQRLKSDTNMIFKRLSELNSGIRILMTGTPLNNNIRELFSLLNFLDPSTWNDIDALESEYEVLDEERVKKLHEMLRPYFLRRVKADVLSLPPKNEVIVPVSLAPLQKEIYKSIISKNVDLLRSLTINPSARVNKSHAKRSNMRNILMELRKCTQHPYLVHEDIEPKNLSVEETHSKMIDASSKLRLLKMLLPKLKAKGHRVLLFSQFKLALNIVEDFLQGEGYKFLRLDGDTKQADRQKSVDTFNHDNSDVFIFILTTRAGGVGINLWSADTVILFDPDFNPHQDLQAIARAHRYGQTKRCLVFKLMTKDTVEEKIMQVGKKKLVLDHLIVQKIHEDDTEDLKSLLTFGAKALFEENNEDRDINYTENDVDDLINKIETEVVEEENNEAFSFARVWSTHKETLDDLIEAENAEETEDSWAQTLKKIAEKRSQLEVKEREKMGRGARRKTAGIKNYYIGDSPEKSPKAKKRRHHDDSSGDEYSRPQSVASEATSASEAILGEDLDLVAHPPAPKGPAQTDSDPFTWQGHSNTALPQLDPPSRYLNGLAELCSLCSTVHKPGQCPQSENAVNLASYRRILVFSIDLSYTERSLAISLIDEQLERLGCTHLTLDQPRKPIKKASIANNNHADVPDSTSVSG